MTIPEHPTEIGGYEFLFATGETGEGTSPAGSSADATLAAAQAAMGKDIDVILGRIDRTIAREKQAIDSLLHRIAGS